MIDPMFFKDYQWFSQVQNQSNLTFYIQRYEICITLLKISEASLSPFHYKLHSLAHLILTSIEVVHNSMRNGKNQIIDNVPMLEIHDLIFFLLLASIPKMIVLYVNIEIIDEGKLEVEFLCL